MPDECRSLRSPHPRVPRVDERRVGEVNLARVRDAARRVHAPVSLSKGEQWGGREPSEEDRGRGRRTYPKAGVRLSIAIELPFRRYPTPPLEALCCVPPWTTPVTSFLYFSLALELFDDDVTRI